MPEATNSGTYQVLITNITWNKDTIKHFKTKHDEDELPTQFALDIPATVIKQANKKGNVFNDIIETFVYNFLARKFNHEAYSCQVWLPLEYQVQLPFDDANSSTQA